MKTTYKHFTYVCDKCKNVVKKMFDCSKLDDIMNYKHCETCKEDTLVLEQLVSSGSSAAIIGEGDRWTRQLSGDFKYIMKNMKKRHPNANIPDY